MSLEFLKTVKSAIKYWYIHLVVGLIFISVGVWVFWTPLESYKALSFIFSISFLVSGIFEIYFAIANRNKIDVWGWTMIIGIVGVIVGILLLLNPEISIRTLPFYIGFVVLFRSMFAIGISIDLKNYWVMDWEYLMAIGILGVLFSFLLLWNPLFAGFTIVFWTALLFIISGVFSIYFSLKLKKLNNLPNKISSNLKSKYEEIKKQIQDEIQANNLN